LKEWNVHKFGGSTFQNSSCYQFVASLVDKFSGKSLVVVSALTGITDLLYRVCRRAKRSSSEETEPLEHGEEWRSLVERISGAIKGRLGDSPAGFEEVHRFLADLIYLRGVLSRMPVSSPSDQEAIEQMVVGYGEIWSARLLTQTLRDEFGRSVAFLDARDVLVVDQQETQIQVLWDITKQRLKKWFLQCHWCDVIVVTGFIARDTEDLPTTLKRNGSDFSATIFSVLTKANSCTIWKDVDGMYTADPKKNPNAKFIPIQTFEEAEEASRRGAFVIQADCIAPAREFGIPIFLRNCFNLDCPGTRIGNPLPVLPSHGEEEKTESDNSCHSQSEEDTSNGSNEPIMKEEKVVTPLIPELCASSYLDGTPDESTVVEITV
jgi:aspartokinase/homoserine dehydrogenase 1